MIHILLIMGLKLYYQNIIVINKLQVESDDTWYIIKTCKQYQWK